MQRWGMLTLNIPRTDALTAFVGSVERFLDAIGSTCDVLLPSHLPREWPDAEAVLVACGRVSRADVPASIAGHLPVI